MYYGQQYTFIIVQFLDTLSQIIISMGDVALLNHSL